MLTAFVPAARYFNAAGCEPQDGLGEDHDPETHLVPNVVRFALKLNKELIIYGNDYPTPDRAMSSGIIFT